MYLCILFQSAADLLAKEVHSDSCFLNFNGIGHELLDQIPEDPFSVENLGIWIDPIGEQKETFNPSI